MPDFSKAEHLIQNGWLAVLFAVLSFVVYVGGLMCSHLSAFRVATNLRLQMLHHLAELPLGFTQQFGSGKLRKTINESSGATETYLLTCCPIRQVQLQSPNWLIALLLFFDWKLGLLSLIPVAAGFLVMTSMTGENMKKKMRNTRTHWMKCPMKRLSMCVAFQLSKHLVRPSSPSSGSSSPSTDIKLGRLLIPKICVFQ